MHCLGSNTPSISLTLTMQNFKRNLKIYCKISNIRCTLVGNKIVDHSDVVEAAPTGLSALLQLHLHFWPNTWLQWIGQRQLQGEMRNIYILGFCASYIRYLTVYLFYTIKRWSQLLKMFPMEDRDQPISHSHHINGLVQERRNSIANTLELHLSCTNPSISWELMFWWCK